MDVFLVPPRTTSGRMTWQVGQFRRQARHPEPDHPGFADHFLSSENRQNRTVTEFPLISGRMAVIVLTDTRIGQLCLPVQ